MTGDLIRSRHVARDFVGHEQADFLQQAPEAGRTALLFAQQRELVLDQGMVHHLNAGQG
jgi:hypothetical protein